MPRSRQVCAKDGPFLPLVSSRAFPSTQSNPTVFPPNSVTRVGGVVSETSFKFFVQFVFWAAIYCIYNLTVMAIFVAESRKKVSSLSVKGRLFAAQTVSKLRHTPNFFQGCKTSNLEPCLIVRPWDGVVPNRSLI